LILAALSAGSAEAQAILHPGDAAPRVGEAPKETPASAADMTEGEVRKVDMSTRKITIRHGAIKNLDMPGMTMVFQIRNPALFDAVKAGDKVRFRAEMAGAAMVVTAIEPAR
jgi:Cu/Ag efflux protein CusF